MRFCAFEVALMEEGAQLDRWTKTATSATVALAASASPPNAAMAVLMTTPHHNHHQPAATAKKRCSSRSWTLLAHNHNPDGRGTSTPLFLQYTVKHVREERRVRSGAAAHMYYVLVMTDTTYDVEVLMPGPMRLYDNRPAFGEQEVSGAWLVEELQWIGVLATAF